MAPPRRVKKSKNAHGPVDARTQVETPSSAAIGGPAQDDTEAGLMREVPPSSLAHPTSRGNKAHNNKVLHIYQLSCGVHLTKRCTINRISDRRIKQPKRTLHWKVGHWKRILSQADLSQGTTR